MKKTLVALAVTAVAASANAATVYEKDGTRIDVEGSFRVFLGKESKNDRTDLRNDGTRLWVKANQNIGNGLSALGAVEMRFDANTTESNTFGNPSANQLFAGFAHKDVGTVTFGRQDTTLDAVQLSDFTASLGGNNNLKTSAEKSVKFVSAEWHGLSIGLDYLFGNANKRSNEDSELKQGYGVSLFYTRDLAKNVAFNFAAGYNQLKFDGNNSTTTLFKQDAWRTSAQLVFGKATVGVEFGRKAHKDVESGFTYERESAFLLGAKYQVIDPASVYFQYQNNKHTSDVLGYELKAKEKKYILGADYKLHQNVLVFAEGYRKDATISILGYSVKAKDNGVGVGLRVFF